jgi:hypothetical protein
MIQEAILAFACINSTGCTNTLNTYAYYNPEIVRNSSVYYENALELMPKAVIMYVFPVMAVVTRQKAVLKLSNNLITEVSSENITVKFTIEY